MAKIQIIASAGPVIETGVFNYQFMFKSEIPFDKIAQISNIFGLVLLKADRGVGVQTNGDDLNARWNIEIFGAQSGSLIGIGCPNQDVADLVDSLKGLPSCVLLASSDASDRLKYLLEEADHDVEVFISDVQLSTSR